jgi:uncharacterized Rossmann fold enzyme
MGHPERSASAAASEDAIRPETLNTSSRLDMEKVAKCPRCPAEVVVKHGDDVASIKEKRRLVARNAGTILVRAVAMNRQNHH